MNVSSCLVEQQLVSPTLYPILRSMGTLSVSFVPMLQIRSVTPSPLGAPSGSLNDSRHQSRPHGLQMPNQTHLVNIATACFARSLVLGCFLARQRSNASQGQALSAQKGGLVVAWSPFTR
ncbi:hypothetical protein LY78DRAFT_662719 [Colletotrichum sublineola]|nr:hypothetical protein LY78DRAFT_662719 [Colletotrichum sublineola]